MKKRYLVLVAMCYAGLVQATEVTCVADDEQRTVLGIGSEFDLSIDSGYATISTEEGLSCEGELEEDESQLLAYGSLSGDACEVEGVDAAVDHILFDGGDFGAVSLFQDGEQYLYLCDQE